MVGNTILLKTLMVPQCAIAIEDLFKEAQAPLGFNLLLSGKEPQALSKESKVFLSQVVKQQVLA
jgi:succinate-semialdehyde dehydrogenase/glutarate-semialdehyde dehydrogenase